MVKRIFAWQTDTAGCFYYRLYLPLTNLPADDWSATWGAPGADIHDYDVVIGQRIAGHNDLWLDICRNPNVLAVYELDDDILNIDPDNTVPYQIYAPLVDGTRQNISAADVVTVSTPKLAEYISSINKNVVVLRNCVSRELVNQVRPRSGQLTVGWAGSMFHQQDWHGMPERLRDFHARVPYAQFHMIGADYTRGLVPTRTTGWSTIDRYYSALDFDIGIAPIVRTPFNERKSWIKLLEYAALGIPAVATNAGQYDEWIEHGVNGFLVANDADWVEYLVMLSDVGYRTSASTYAREKADKFTIERQFHHWADAYSGRM